MKYLLKRNVYPREDTNLICLRPKYDEVKILKTLENVKINVGKKDKYETCSKGYIVEWNGHELICGPKDLIIEDG